MNRMQSLQNVQDELVGGSLEEEEFYFEARLIRRGLERANGRVTETARILGITHQGHPISSGVVIGILLHWLDERNEFAARPLEAINPIDFSITVSAWHRFRKISLSFEAV